MSWSGDCTSMAAPRRSALGTRLFLSLATMLVQPGRVGMNAGAVPDLASSHLLRPLPSKRHGLVEGSNAEPGDFVLERAFVG